MILVQRNNSKKSNITDYNASIGAMEPTQALKGSNFIYESRNPNVKNYASIPRGSSKTIRLKPTHIFSPRKISEGVKLPYKYGEATGEESFSITIGVEKTGEYYIEYTEDGKKTKRQLKTKDPVIAEQKTQLYSKPQ